MPLSSTCTISQPILNMTSNDIEDMQVELVAEVKSAITIPLAVKISPFVTSIPNFAKRLVDAGADGLVLFNRFYQPDFDLDDLDIVHTLDLSTSAELRLPLRWISILNGKINTDFALTSGVHTQKDVMKAMMAGAKVAMMASTLLYNGEQYVRPAVERTGTLDEGARIYIHPADAGQHESKSREGTGCI